MSFQHYIIQGRITRDLEVKQVGGTSLCKFSVAFTEREKDKNGQWVDVPQFWEVDVWGTQADNCIKYLSKGKPVLVAGKIKQRKYEDKNGANRVAYSISASSVTFLGSKGNDKDDSDEDNGVPMPFGKNKTGEPSIDNESELFGNPFGTPKINHTDPFTAQGKLEDDKSLPF